MKTLAWGEFCKHDFPFLHIAYKKYRFSENRAPFGSARPCFAATSFKFPPHRIIGGNLRCCCSAGLLRRVSPSATKPAYLRGCFRCSFLFFFPLAFSFSFPSLIFFTGLPRLPIFPLPSRSFFSSSPTSALPERDSTLPMCSSQAHTQDTPLQPNFLIQTV